MGKKISVIVPVYNMEKYLVRCIESIQQQTYPNLEIICINDGSTDASGQILEEMAKKDSRLVIIHQENSGVSSARNAGLKRATGDYIGFVDSDDYIDRDMYRALIENIEVTGSDIAACGFSFDYDGKIVPATNQKPVPEGAIPTKEFLKYVYERDVYKGVSGYIYTRLYKKNLIKDENEHLNIQFNEKAVIGEDHMFLAEVSLHSNMISYVNIPLYYYYQRSDSIMHDKEKQIKSLSWILGYEYVIKLYKENNISDDIVGLVIRMYVYLCGKHMEYAIELKNWDKYEELVQKASAVLDVYERTNVNYPERVEWMKKLLECVWEK